MSNLQIWLCQCFLIYIIKVSHQQLMWTYLLIKEIDNLTWSNYITKMEELII